MRLPSARGPVSAHVLETLSGTEDGSARPADSNVARGPDVLADEDVQLALWVLYELHYRGFEGVDDDCEWDPGLLELRRRLEGPFEAELRRRTSAHVRDAMSGDGDVADRMFALTGSFEAPSVARYVQREATGEQLVEFMMHRSIYHLKESDPQSWVVARISGKPKAALVELQYDEYGAGRPERLHATMFGDALEGCGLDREYGAYLDQVPAHTLAGNNAMSLFGLHRRLRAAALGHLGAFEATSSQPCRRLAGGVRRLGLPDQVATYFDEHIEADAVHEQLALREICGALVEQDPSLEQDVFFGAATCLLLDAVSGEAMLGAWLSSRSSLRGGDLEPEAVA